MLETCMFEVENAGHVKLYEHLNLLWPKNMWNVVMCADLNMTDCKGKTNAPCHYNSIKLQLTTYKIHMCAQNILTFLWSWFWWVVCFFLF